ncbi:MAG: LysR family transcriptional regulator [Puniceicoccales bacterium]|jgi:DNA-binding transcriptional LysR family regulator|nr:LysR family transcriptional regulator [Puniceicoccales bacterium]
MLNPHHLELFYYVAQHGGISAAVRHIPYGIQQPAVSLQIVRLEEALDVTLFHRRPFSLTTAGEKLFAHIKPFFEGLAPLEEQLRGRADLHLNIGAAEFIQREYMPAALTRLRTALPGLRLTMREGPVDQLLDAIRSGEMDVAIGVIEDKEPRGVQTIPLAKFHPALVVNNALKIKTAKELWDLDRITHPLICLPPYEWLCRVFQSGLAKIGVVWEPSMELASIPLVEKYAAEDFGIGLTFSIPGKKVPSGTKLIPLNDFPSLTIAAFWDGRPSPAKAALLEEFVTEAGIITRKLNLHANAAGSPAKN